MRGRGRETVAYLYRRCVALLKAQTSFDKRMGNIVEKTVGMPANPVVALIGKVEFSTTGGCPAFFASCEYLPQSGGSGSAPIQLHCKLRTNGSYFDLRSCLFYKGLLHATDF